MLPLRRVVLRTSSWGTLSANHSLRARSVPLQHRRTFLTEKIELPNYKAMSPEEELKIADSLEEWQRSLKPKIPIPKRIYSKAGRSAERLWAAAGNEGGIEGIRKAAAELVRVANSPAIHELCASHYQTIHRTRRLNVFLKENNISSVVADFLHQLVIDRTIMNVEAISVLLNDLVNKHDRKVVGTATYATQQDLEAASKDKSSLERLIRDVLLAPEDRLELIFALDAALEGGVVLQVGEHFLDFSVSNARREIRERLDEMPRQKLQEQGLLDTSRHVEPHPVLIRVFEAKMRELERLQKESAKSAKA